MEAALGPADWAAGDAEPVRALPAWDVAWDFVVGLQGAVRDSGAGELAAATDSVVEASGAARGLVLSVLGVPPDSVLLAWDVRPGSAWPVADAEVIAGRALARGLAAEAVGWVRGR